MTVGTLSNVKRTGLRRLALTATLLAVLVVPLGATGRAEAASDDGSTIAVSVGGSYERNVKVSTADVRAGDVSATYAVRTSPDGPTTDRSISGLSVRELLDEYLGLPADLVTSATITIGGSTVATLTATDLGDPGDAAYPYPDGLRPAFFDSGSGSIGYISPLRDEHEPNELDENTAGNAVSLTVETTAAKLEPVVAADSTSIDKGDSVAFTAKIPGGGSSSFRYEWDFQDGPTDTDSGSKASHAFASGGVFRVMVTVTSVGGDGEFGFSKPVTITVTGDEEVPEPEETKTPTSVGSGVKHTTAPTTGPNNSDGNRGGAAAGDSNPSRARDGKGDTGATGSDPTGTTTAAPVAGDQVTGVLIDGVATVVQPQVQPSSAAQAATAPGAAAGDLPNVGWVVIALGILALLGAGMAAESGLLGKLAAQRAFRRPGTSHRTANDNESGRR